MSTTPPSPSTAAPGGIFKLGGDLPVHRLGFGAMRITGEGVWGPPKDKAEALRVLRRAVELGVNFIDTSDAYGPDISEGPHRRGALPISGRVGHRHQGRPAAHWPRDNGPRKGRPEHLKEACEGSLKRLRLDCIDLYQFHRPDPKVPFEDSVGAMAELQKAGKVRHVGLSNVSTAQLAQAPRDRARRDRAEPLQPHRPQQRGSVGGVRTGGHRVHAVGTHFTGQARQAGPASSPKPQAPRGGISAGQMTLAWLLAHSPVMLPIPGTGSVAHLEENMAAAELELMPDEISAIGEAAGR